MSKKKVVLVTGCNNPQGIGFATVHQLASEDCIVYATVRNETKSKELQNSIKKHENIHIKYLDITSEKMIVALVSDIIQEQARIDVLINNAGYGLIGAVEEVTIEQAKREYDVNVFGTIRLTQEILPHMRRAKTGHIINVSTMFCNVLSIPLLPQDARF